MTLQDESRWHRKGLLVASACGILVIAVVDWKIKPNVSLGLLYVLPILVGGLWLSRAQIVAVAALCAVLREAFSPSAWDADLWARAVFVVVAFAGAGLFTSELARNRHLAIEHGRQLQEEVRRREEAETQLRVLIESSPAAILTANGDGRILLANEAARRLLAIDLDPPERRLLASYVPSMASVLPDESSRPGFRTALECLGRSGSGEVFLAHVWFSTYRTSAGPRLAAIILDASEHLRDREALGLSATALTSRIVLGALSHEIRNLAAAAAVAHTNLTRTCDLAQNEDFRALGALVQGLERLASTDLRLVSDRARAPVDLETVLDQLRIVLQPMSSEASAELRWEVPAALPRVWGDPHGLMQVFLNLAQNSLREMGRVDERELAVSASIEGEWVLVRFEDTGPGIPAEERLFQPFRDGGGSAGLGLYVSRAIARSFAGDLRLEPRTRGSCFVVQLVPAP